ncbi:class I SAM-dependent methyltransferase [Bordetella genomosp. 13]|uniref:class I SAM-dependent methyltransferase n=1 Tax=Bordetella genomosp. 13 TaxID=463040 RepID=UPI0011AB1736|nr:class I SAM-dependent methyltransferase [Bordetella genomosp. 13]
MTDFDAMYRSASDPWKLRTDWYERRKLDVLMACLPRERYGLALDLGCGEGEAARRLAGRCERVQAVDGSPAAIARCCKWIEEEDVQHVTAEVLQLPHQWPAATRGAVDLLVVSELAYYLSDQVLDLFLCHCLRSLAPGADWAMCHYTEDFHDRRQSTSRIHARVDALSGFGRIVTHEDARFRLDVWRKPGESAT